MLAVVAAAAALQYTDALQLLLIPYANALICCFAVVGVYWCFTASEVTHMLRVPLDIL